MVDLHSHLLYNYDDGAENREESIRMLEMYSRIGCDIVTASSHSNLSKSDEYAEKFADLADVAGNLGITLLEGSEYCLNDLLALSADQLQSKPVYLMLDLGVFPVDNALVNKLMPLIARKKRLLFAHPERLWGQSVLKRIELFSMLPGSAFQVNAGSLLGVYGKEARLGAWKMLTSGKCHTIASDAHDTCGVDFLSEARKMLERFAGKETVEILFDRNPRAIISGKTPERHPVKLSWFRKLELGL